MAAKDRKAKPRNQATTDLTVVQVRDWAEHRQGIAQQAREEAEEEIAKWQAILDALSDLD